MIHFIKTKQLFFLALFALTIVSASCSREKGEVENNNNNQNPTSGSNTCNVHVAALTASPAVVATNSNGLLTITGSDNNAHECQATPLNRTEVGSYPESGSTINPNTGRWTKGIGNNDTYSTMLGLETGTVEITELTANMIKGTFSFNAKYGVGSEVSISEGSFNTTISQ